MYNARVFNPEEFAKHFLGFDSIESTVEKFNKLSAEIGRTTSSYPPYNIIKTGDTTYKLEIAVAGFSKSDIDIEIDSGKLIIRGVSHKLDANDYIFHGIATRDFSRVWALQDNIIVQSAEFCNGLLSIALEKVLPEALKPRKVEISELTQEQKDAIADKM